MTRPSLLRVILATLLATVVAACGLDRAAPSPSPVPSPDPTATPVVSASSDTGCAGADLRATSTGWGGAAGSRGADVIVENVGDASCTVDGPMVAVVDEAGSVLVQGEAPSGAMGTTIDAAGTSSFSFTFSNWCDPAPPLPLHVTLVIERDLVTIEGLPIATVDDLPPCNGEGQPASISTLAWAQG